MIQDITSPVVVSSKPTFAFVALATCIFSAGLFVGDLPHDGRFVLFALIVLFCFFGLWLLAYEYAIDSTQIVVKPAFGLAQPRIIPMSQITALRCKPDAYGGIARFEVWTAKGRTVQLHLYQTRLMAGIALIRLARSDLDEVILSRWAL